MPLDLAPTRDAALKRLDAFAPRAGRAYAEGRNHDLPQEGHPHVSALSPYLRHRMVTEEEVLRAVLGRHSRDGAQKFVTEVYWRTYFKGFLEMRPTIWSDHRRGLDRALDRVATESGLRREWEAACAGETGIEPFDAWAREIVQVGYLHNHARMWFASIWMFTLRLPMELGSDFFLRNLLDGDPASNTLSWRWVGGLHTPGKTYAATESNIAKHTGGRFSGELRLARGVSPVRGPANPPAMAAPEPRAWEATPRTGLLIHEDDLSPDFLLARLEPAAVALMNTTRDRSPLEVDPGVVDFAEAALLDCADRLSLDTGAPLADAEAVAAWARAASLDQVVAPYPPVGPAAEALRRAEALLEPDGIAVTRVLRPYDAEAWPHATHGFFRFKDAIPRLLDGIGAAEAA
jgi:deoxyribodipyrimidine photo-lyase